MRFAYGMLRPSCITLHRVLCKWLTTDPLQGAHLNNHAFSTHPFSFSSCLLKDGWVSFKTWRLGPDPPTLFQLSAKAAQMQTPPWPRACQDALPSPHQLGARWWGQHIHFRGNHPPISLSHTHNHTYIHTHNIQSNPHTPHHTFASHIITLQGEHSS